MSRTHPILALLACLLCAVPALAVVAEIGTSNSADTGTGTSATLTFAHDAGTGSNRLTVVMVAIRTATPDVSATYAGDAMTPIMTESLGGQSCVLLYVVNPDTGSNNVVVTNNDAQRITAGAISLSGVDQVDAVGDTDSTCVDEGTSITRTLTSAVGDMVVDVVAMSRSDEGSFVVGASQTEEWADVTTNATPANNVRGAGSTEPGGASVTMSWSWSSAADVCQCAASLNAVASTTGMDALQPILQ